MRSKQPNILMIVIDCARYDRLGIHGYRKDISPNIDALAEEAVDYTNANSPGGSTRVAMGAIFTGLYPQAYGFEEGQFPDHQHSTFTEALAATGYQTILYSNNPYVSQATGYNRGFRETWYLNRSQMRKKWAWAVTARHALRLAKASWCPRTSFKLSSDMLVWLTSQRIKSRTLQDLPFFIYLHLDAHAPYLSDRAYLNRFLHNGVDEPLLREVELLQRKYPHLTCFAQSNIPPDQRNRYHAALRSMYDASVAKADEQVGHLCSMLRQNKLWDNTTVIVTSDHGEFLGERNLIVHGLFPYEEAMHVPLLIKYPKGIKSPGSDQRLTSTIDIGPTLRELCGVSTPADGQGISTLDAAQHEYVICQRRNFEQGWDVFSRKYPEVRWEEFDLGSIVAMKDERYKFVWTSSGKVFLFDLLQDPAERHNLAEGNGVLLQTHQSRFDTWRNQLKVSSGSPEADYEESILEHLRELGYVE